MTAKLAEKVKSHLKHYNDFPTKGVVFQALVEEIIDAFVEYLRQLSVKIDVIVGLEARGFLFGPLIALKLKVPFVPVRKAGKLPGECIQATYQKEYGMDVFEMQKDCSIARDSHVVIVDDLIALGGSASSAAELVKRLGGRVVSFLFLIEIVELNGRTKLLHTTQNVFSLVKV